MDRLRSDWEQAKALARRAGRRAQRGEPAGDGPGPGTEDRLFAQHHVRTDLALEAHQVVARAAQGPQIPGVFTEEQDLGFGKLHRVSVETEEGAQIMGKAVGRYLTLEVPGLQGHNKELENQVSQALAVEIQNFLSRLGVQEGQTVLTVGLGNWNATPDNVGPLTISKLLVTRHLHQYQVLSQELLASMRPVAALSPGVLGLTGVETAEIVQGVVQKIQPAAVICIDALASMSVDRIGKTFQLADVGINPGSGVGNKRVGLNQETLGVPVLVLGVPTVIYATTIVADAMDRMASGTAASAAGPGTGAVQGGRLDPARIMVDAGRRQGNAAPIPPSAPFPSDAAARKEMIRQVLGESMGTLVVTPKEVDVMVDILSDILADALNEALHPGITAEEAAQLR